MPQVVHGISTEVTVTESSVVRLSRRLSNPRCLYTSLNISLFRMMAMNWSAVQMFKDNPDTTVEATMLVRPRMKCKKIRVMLSSMPLADMAPPKHMAQMISQIVFIIPAIPRVETREFKASLPVCICVLS